MVVRGDGTLMSAQTALDRPVDTLLSGPAASILGAKHLSGLTRALIVDMGGTTTDMASLSAGKVSIDSRGAKVGKWRTHV
jgi:N-methylhydantoinase A/oxoprolinase/acetone carboxylase beta subunit